MPFNKNYKNPVTDKRQVKNLYEFVKDNADDYGDMPFYTYYIEKNKTAEITYRRYFEDILSLGAAFDTLGLRGCNIAVLGSAHPAFMETYHAAVWGGGIIFPLDKDVNDERLVQFIQQSDIAAVVFMPSEEERFKSLYDVLSCVRYFISVDESFCCENPRFLSYYDLLSKGKTGIPEFEKIASNPDIEKTCAVIYTSGTTGTSKGIMLSQKNLCTATYSAAKAIYYLPRGVRLLSVLPMNHTYEVTCTHLAATFYGANIFLNNSLKYFTRNLSMFKPQLLVLVPLFAETLYKKLIEGIKEKNKEKTVKTAIKISRIFRSLGIDLRKKLFSSLTDALGGEICGIICGGAPISSKITVFYSDIGIDLVEGYGITECSPLVAVNSLKKLVPGSVGKPVLGCKVKIDSKDGDGEILVKGDNVMLGYYNNPEDTKEVFTDDGYFRTGDIGHLDKDGNIYISGRIKNLIILSNGKNIYPEELEEYLSQIDEIKECVVVSRKKQSGEEAITALIYPDPDKTKDMTDDEKNRFFREKTDVINKSLPTYKQITEIELRNVEFEKTTTKKIKRFTIK